ncbi:hypothetical protein [Vibrio ziniensis]|uniref:Uncharacterized protein n=1 Tax=Vibrio ziniensis TaxID=2711221 RepID=A0A6G7CLP0_9VIBR|nr:hypothetical protein [Vibrio ziniensis]QIH42966.1 hypothetical protein G5S32_13880 [Vibrio ziniensis]
MKHQPRLGLSTTHTLITICLIASALAGFGIWGKINEISETIMFYCFMICFMAYALMLNYIWRVTTWVRALNTN